MAKDNTKKKPDTKNEDTWTDERLREADKLLLELERNDSEINREAQLEAAEELEKLVKKIPYQEWKAKADLYIGQLVWMERGSNKPSRVTLSSVTGSKERGELGMDYDKWKL